MPVLYTVGQWTVAPLLKLGWAPEIEGRENIPETGGAIFAGNHLSVADEFMLGAVVSPRRVSFWAKSDYFTGKGPSGLFFRTLMNGLGAIPVNREGGRAALSAFDSAIPVLQEGGLVCVYPEGTRSPDGRLYRGRTGVARLALAAGVPIIPVGSQGTDKIQPTGQVLPKLRRGEVTIKFGKPIVVDKWQDAESTSSAAREITDTVMSAIQALTGQEYVPRYAPKRVES
ncbi:1-acyl-sn-glycerol-3-phosphate acyltransferase [Hamadaea flava]|uniref:Lysophospholipid acyltransferase family protein n=1 Tax=Hamadaea flava TaxID=1742688 RepID=A0ABV8LVH9_9ACTN|nr:lysophospholipid acyltransferase family protein [Hamadaea flava]MCP2327392.1 1-acyl-sn-glycerol-3-phosphate acyltransferase [Hamadaea flava]